MPAVEPPLHGRHADRVGVEHAGGVRIVAQLGRVAGDEQDVAHAAGRAGQQVGLHADQVAVAAAEVQDRLDAGLLLDALGGDQRRDPRTGPRAVGDVDRIDAVLAGASCSCRSVDARS